MGKIRKINIWVIITGLAVGIAALLLTHFGNPDNMGFCIACFVRDTAGAMGMHQAAIVQYVRPEIIGLILGSFILAVITKQFKPKAGSSPAVRFILGACVVIGALVFLGCPLRMVIRMGGGDLNAFVGLAGFAIGILIGIFFIKKGFSLKRNYAATVTDGAAMPFMATLLLALVIIAPSIFLFSETGPGSKHAPILLSLGVAMVVGALAQKSRICMVGGMRDAIMFRDFNLLLGFIVIFVVILGGNVVLGKFGGFSTYLQPIAHAEQLWNLLGMVIVGWGSVLLGGCPLRQLILAGEGNGDSAVTVFGMLVGAAVAHNFKLAGSGASVADDGTFNPGGVADTGKYAVAIIFAILIIISVMNIAKKNKKA